METLNELLGIAENIDTNSNRVVDLKVALYDRLKANGEALMDAKRQNSHAWILLGLDTDTPKAEQVEIASLPKELVEKLEELKRKPGPGKRFYACTGKEATSRAFGMAKPNASWQLLT